MSVLEELKRRNVFRVAGAYLVVAWLLIEVSSTLFPILKLPEWAVTLVAVLLLVGFLPVRDYFVNPGHSVEHVPSAILAAGLMMLSFLFSFTGLLLHVINHRFRELHNVITRQVDHRKPHHD